LVAVEAALVLPLIVTLMLGVWEVGELVQMSMIVTDAARAGARMAAGGTNSGTPATVAMVQTVVQNYLTAAGVPAAAVSGATIQVINNSSDSWTDPGYAQPLDPFTVVVTIPAGTAFNSISWSFLSSITGITQLVGRVQWYSANDAETTVSTTIPLLPS
jgi:Flp pilus assembly protein TadG